MKTYLNQKRRASASVMVLIMSVIVITLGLSFVLLSKTNLKLASKNVDWLSDYYRLESLVNEDISTVENYLKLHYDSDKAVAEQTDSIEKGISSLLHSTFSVEASKEGLKIKMFIESSALKDRHSGNQFAISCSLRYDSSNSTLLVDAIEETPPEMEYESFY